MSLSGRSIIIERDCKAILVPSGQVLELKAGTPVRVTQALGNNYSVEVFGQLVMIASLDADALGIEIDPNQHQFLQDDSLSVEDKAILLLKTCYDPEIPVNIYDLGLIYTIEISEDNDAKILMSLTAPGCPVAGEMPGWVSDAVKPINGLKSVHVEIVWEPQWGMEMMSDEARLELGFM